MIQKYYDHDCNLGLLDGKTIAKVSAPYTQEELDRRETRAARKRGVR